MNFSDLEALVGTELPDGSYLIEPEAHAKAVGAVHAEDYAFGVAHPVYAHVAPHCGMGWNLPEFFDMVGADMDSGVLFGEGDLTYHQPMLIGVDYLVRGHIASVERKRGSRAGVFDLVTLHLELVDPDNILIVVSDETYVFPRTAEAAS
jgi:hypothetical protein